MMWDKDAGKIIVLDEARFERVDGYFTIEGQVAKRILGTDEESFWGRMNFYSNLATAQIEMNAINSEIISGISDISKT